MDLKLVRFGSVLILLSFLPAQAETAGCEAFDWPLKQELALLTAEKIKAVVSGSKLESAPAEAIELALKPAKDVALPVRPAGGGKHGGATPQAGFVEFSGIRAGLYQVTVSAPVWIDAIQTGAAVTASAHTGKPNCPGMRKSVRFELKDAPLILQFSDSAEPSVRVVVRPVEK